MTGRGQRVAARGSQAATSGPRSRRESIATLACGAVAEYEASDLVPAAGDVVPCRRHGHCAVLRPGRVGGGGLERPVPPRPRRSAAELATLLQRRGTVTLRALREERFSLRLIAEAERAGDVDVDLLTGVVTLRSAASHPGRARSEPGTAA